MSLRLCFFLVAVGVGSFQNSEHVMTGEPLAVPVNSTGVLKAARFAVIEFNRANEDERFAYRIMNITSAKMQIVAGLNYILEVRLGRTVCKRRDSDDGELCPLHPETKEYQCHFVITEIPWKNLITVTHKYCHQNKD